MDSTGFLASWRPAFPGCLPAPQKKARAPRGSRLDASKVVDDSPFQVFVRFRPGQGASAVVPAGTHEARYGEWRAHYHAVFGENAGQDEVYDVASRRVVNAFCNGVNGTIIAYGQSGTGKTHTMGGLPQTSSGPERGIIPRVLEDVFADGGMATCSFLQIYINEKVYDLLEPEAGWKPLEVRDDGVAASVEGLRSVAVSSAQEVLELFQEGSRRRAMGSTVLNDTSSRSHAILTLRKKGSSLHLADLAGSERLAGSGASDAIIEQSKAINGSLLVLARVIAKLTQNNGNRASHVPFRDSKLTTLLRESLGGNCRTSLIATLSAANEEEAARTLRFAARATYVENIVEKEAEEKDKAEKTRKLKEEDEQLDAARLAVQSLAVVDGLLMVPTCAGKVACNLYGAISVGDRVVLLLHGNPSSSREMAWMAEALQPAGFTAIGVDQPGFGGSAALAKHNSHSSHACDQGGPVDVLQDVLNYFGVKRACIFGFDWGGGIALAFAGRHPRRVARLVLYHPMYNETPAGELAQLKVPVNLLWVKTDQFHPIKTGKLLEKRIPKCSITVYDVGKFDPKTYREEYKKVHPELAAKTIAMFQEAVDAASSGSKGAPAQATKSKSAAKFLAANAGSSLDSSASTSASSASDFSCDDGWTTEEEMDPQRKEQKRIVRGCLDAGTALLAEAEQMQQPSCAAAGAWLRRAYEEQALPYFYACYLGKGSISARPLLTRIFTALPVIAPGISQAHLVAAGLWTPEEAAILSAALPENLGPRFFVGRHAAVMSSVISSRVEDGLRALESGNDGGFAYRTPNARISGFSGTDVLVQLETLSGGTRETAVSGKHLVEQNNPTVFQQTACGRGIILEDGVKCIWASTLLRARLCEMAITISEALKNTVELRKIQTTSVLAIRRHLNVTCLYDAVDRHRFVKGEVEKLMTFGCCHCHGLTSIMAAAVLPFSKMLGIDMRYTGGYHAHEGDLEICNNVERHQWLELSFRPTMETVVCDLTLAGCPVDGPRWRPEWLLKPVAEAFQIDDNSKGGLYANGKAILGSTVAEGPDDFA